VNENVKGRIMPGWHEIQRTLEWPMTNGGVQPQPSRYAIDFDHVYRYREVTGAEGSVGGRIASKTSDKVPGRRSLADRAI